MQINLRKQIAFDFFTHLLISIYSSSPFTHLGRVKARKLRLHLTVFLIKFGHSSEESHLHSADAAVAAVGAV